MKNVKQLINKLKNLHPMVYVLWGVILLCIYSLIFGACEYKRGWNNALKSLKPDTITNTTITHDTVSIEKPTPTYQYITKTITDTFKYTQIDTFNQVVEVEVPITQRTYTDSLYTAYISGYKPQLDSINIYTKTITHTQTINNYIKKKPKLTISAGLGYGYSITDKKLTPQIAIQIGLPIKNIY